MENMLVYDLGFAIWHDLVLLVRKTVLRRPELWFVENSEGFFGFIYR